MATPKSNFRDIKLNWVKLEELNACVLQDDRVPEGYKTVILKAYSNGELIVFPEQPAWQRPDDEDDLSHDCDAEGCGSFDHVMRTVPVRRDWEHETRLIRAIDLLRRFYDAWPCDVPPSNDDRTFFRDYYLFTGAHMILTEDGGWEPGSAKASYVDEGYEECILEEINVPKE